MSKKGILWYTLLFVQDKIEVIVAITMLTVATLSEGQRTG
jgi:hypothetical protein